jgi:hypothetical protein
MASQAPNSKIPGGGLAAVAQQLIPGNANFLTNNLISENGLPTAPRQHFLDQLQEWETTLPLTSMWMIFFDIPKIVQDDTMNHWGENHLGIDWGVDSAKDRLTSRGSLYDGYGCALAQTVGIPVEQMGIDTVGPTNRGFLKGPIVQQRQAFAALNIEFLETTLSFNDFVLRPWVILASHMGLVKRENPAAKITTDIFVVNMARAGVDQKYDTGKGQWSNSRGFIPRKIWLFKDCIPVNVAQETYTYGTGGDVDRRDTEWNFRKYQVIAPNSLISSMETINAQGHADATKLWTQTELIHKKKKMISTTQSGKTEATAYWDKKDKDGLAHHPKVPRKKQLARAQGIATNKATDYWAEQEPPRPGGSHTSAATNPKDTR